MAHKVISPNHREAITAVSSITGQDEYILSTNGAIDINGTIGGSPIPISGATTGVGVAILDGSGNQITSFGGGTQYTDGAATVAHPIGTIPVFNNAGTITAVSVANPLPVNASVTISGVSTASNQTSGAQKTQIVDGSGNVIAATSNALNTNITNSSIAVTGTFFQATQPISGTVTANQGGTWSTTVTQATAASLNATIVGTGTFAAQVTGTVTANAGTNLNTSLLALESGGNLASIKTDVDNLNLAQASTTSGQKGNLILGAVTTGAPTYTTAQSNPLSLDTAGNLRTTTTLGASSNVIGHVITDTGSTTAITGTVAATQSGTWTNTVTQTTAANLNATVVGTGTFAVQATLAAETTKVIGTVNQGTSPWVNNTSQINGVTPLMGNGTTGTGSQRVTIASDNTAFSVNSVQSTGAALTAGWVVINGEQNDTTGTFTNATQTTSVTATNLAGYGNVLISINGTYGTATAIFEGSDDGGTTWYTISEAARTDTNVVEGGYTTLTNTTRAWQTNNPGWDSLRVRSTAVASGTVNVRISPSAAPSAAGATVQLGSAIPTGSNVIGHVITDSGSVIAGGTASGSSLTASPLTGGGLAKTANPTAVADGQVVNALHDKLGKQVVVGSIRDLKGNQFTTITASTSETTVVTQVASTFLDVYGVIVENTSATASKVTFKDSTAGTTQFEIYVPAGDTRGFMLPESGAFKQTTVNTNWTATCGTSVSSIVISVLYVKNL